MNLELLSTFLAVLDAGTLGRAADRLHVSPSTVTTRIQLLEAELGQMLLVRDRSGVTPTAAGTRLVRHAETMVGLWEQLRSEARLAPMISAAVHLGCHPDLWPGFGQPLFDRIRVEHPDTAVSISIADGPTLLERLERGTVDAIVTPEAHRGELEIVPLGSDELIVVATTPDTPTAFDPGYVYVDAGAEFGRWHAATYAHAAVARLGFDRADLAVAHILANGGSTYAPRSLVTPHLDAGSLHALDAPAWPVTARLAADTTAAGDWPWWPRADANPA